MSDLYTRVVLTVIAAALVLIALRGVGSPVPAANAGDSLDCRITNGIQVDDFRDTLQVKIDQPYGQAGSSSSSPLYVKMVN